MKTTENLKEMVKEKYGQIALQESSCCVDGGSCCGDEVNGGMADDYKTIEGYNPEADLGLGCGLPTQFAKIRRGDVVVDLGSGAGNDAFVARNETGPEGKVIGVDFTEKMIEKARANTEKLGLSNVEFRLGDIEKMPVSNSSVDVVISNCVLNLVPNKTEVFKEIHRVLKPGGHFSISDIVLVGELPDKIKTTAEMYAGCISGAIQKEDYLGLINDAGFTTIAVQKEKVINVPDRILKDYMTEKEIEQFRNSTTDIFSITVFAKKDSCCKPGSGCC